MRTETAAKPVVLARVERAAVSGDERPVHRVLVDLVEEAERSSIGAVTRGSPPVPTLGQVPRVESFD